MNPSARKPQGLMISGLKARLKRHWIVVTVILTSVLIAGGFIFAIYKLPNQDPVAIINTERKKPAQKFYSNLTGKEVADEAAVKAPVTGIMIENSIDARPQSGLKKAGIVYEAVAEGGITRFLAVYQHDKPQLIGPVRSLRMHYLDWAAPYQASIAHVGGSPNALAEVRNGAYRDIDQFFNSGTYWRSTDRYAPHNVYTNFENIDALNANKQYSESDFEGFKRKDGKKAEEPSASSVTVNISGPAYNTSYAYDPASNTYMRSLAGEPHLDREEGQLSPDVVVVLKLETQVRPNSGGYEDIVTTGSGQAFIFQNGIAAEVTWKKDDRTKPLRLVDGEGKDVELNRGQTWIAALTNRGDVSWQ